MSASNGKPKRLVSYPLYTMGDVGSGLYSVLPSILLMFYMTNVLGIPVALATLAAFVPKIVDLISNPIIGGLSDRTRTRLGRRRPFMLLAAVTVMPTFAMMWIAPYKDPAASAYFVLVMFSLCTLSFCCFVVPFFALNTELARDYHERTALNSYRTSYTFTGAILAGAGAPLIVQMAGGGRHGYLVMGLVMGVIMSAVIFMTFTHAREPERSETDPVPTIRETIAAIGSNRPFAILFGSYFVNITAGGLYGAVLAYFVTYVLGRGEGFLSVMFFMTYGASILSIPFWGWISRSTGKLLAFQASIVMSVLASVCFFFISSATPLPLIIAVVFVQGLSHGGVQVFSFSMLADCVSQGNEGRDSADASAAMFNAVFIAGEKLGFASGALLGGLVFSATGLIATTQGSVAQPESAIDGIRVALSWLPAALNMAAVVMLLFYRPFERKMLAQLKAAEI